MRAFLFYTWFLASTLQVSGCKTLESVSQPKILGGEKAVEGQFPATIRLATLMCTGTVIGAQTILTAAHCVSKIDEPVMRSTLAPGAIITFHYGADIGPPINVQVVGVEVHPTWFAKMREAQETSQLVKQQPQLLAAVTASKDVTDIAVIRVKENLNLPIAAIDSSVKQIGEQVTIQGYGLPSASSPGPGKVLHFFKKKINGVDARKYYFNRESDVDPASIKDMKNVTTGDSGGAVYCGADAAKICGVNSGGLTSGAKVEDIFAQLESQGIDPYVDGAFDKLLLGSYFAARIDTPDVMQWIHDRR